MRHRLQNNENMPFIFSQGACEETVNIEKDNNVPKLNTVFSLIPNTSITNNAENRTVCNTLVKYM